MSSSPGRSGALRVTAQSTKNESQSPGRSGMSPGRGRTLGASGSDSPGQSGMSPGRGYDSPGRAEQDDEDVNQTEEVPEVVAFVDKGIPSTFFASMVLANAAFIGIDTDVRATGQSLFIDAGTVRLANYVFFVVFTVELILRIVADRCPAFFYSGWNLLDAFLVGSSAFDLLMEMTQGAGGAGLGKMRAVRLVKMFRLVRLLRLLRVFRFKRLLRLMRGLIMLVFAIFTALRALGWVLLMFLLLTYLIAIITTEFIGMEDNSVEGEADPEIQAWFGDMLKSMFTLVQLTTLTKWAHVTRHVAALHGEFWIYFFTMYVLATNSILMNVVLATLIEKLILLNEEVKEAKHGELSDIESWMITPSELASESSEDLDKKKEEEEKKKEAEKAAVGGPPTAATEKLAMTNMSEFFDIAKTWVGVEGQNSRTLVTQKSLADALAKPDVQAKILQVCPALAMEDGTLGDTDDVSQKIWEFCPRRQDTEGLTRQELAEACMVLRGELCMNHFVVISQALQSMESQIDHELVHLNKHQRKMNRRFLKLRHRLRKVYKYDGAPRKMVELVNDFKNKQKQKPEDGKKSSGAVQDKNSREEGSKGHKKEEQKALKNSGEEEGSEDWSEGEEEGEDSSEGEEW